MKTEEAPAREDAPPPAMARPFLRAWVLPGAAASLVAAILLVCFLSLFPLRGYTVPIGWDASEYLWRTRVAQTEGLEQSTVPQPTLAHPKSGRPGYLVVGATLSSLAGVNPLRLQIVMSSVLCVVIALAAGAFVSGTLRRPWWESGAVALVVGFSPGVIRLMYPEGYLDTMLALAVFTVAVTAAVFALEDRRAVLPAALLLGAGGVVHWTFFWLTAALLIVLAVLLLPASWGDWRRRSVRLLDTPVARLGEVVVAGGVFGAGVLFGALGERLPRARTDVSEFVKKLSRDLPKYHFALTVPAAAVGAASLARPAWRTRRARQGERTGSGGLPARRAWSVLALLLAWSAVVAAGFVGRRYLHLPLPAHRFLSFGLAIPILVALGLVWVGRLAVRLGRRGSRAGIAFGSLVVIVGLAAAGTVAHVQWFGVKPYMDRWKVYDAGLAGSYLDAERIPLDQPFVLIMGSTDWNSVSLIAHTARAGLPPDRLPALNLYVGTPQAYLEHRPIDTAVSRSYFGRIEPLYARNPIAIDLAAFDPQDFDAWEAGHPQTRVAPRIAVIQGPVRPLALASQAPSTNASWWLLGLLAVVALVTLAAAGIGWTRWLLGRWLRPIEVIAVSPAVGIAALVLVGGLVDRLGVRLSGAPGAAVPLLTALLGWVGWAALGRRTAEPPPAPAGSG